MSVAHTHFSPWPEGENLVFEALGGRDSLRLWIKARDFYLSQYVYSTENFTISILVHLASMTYTDRKGRKRRLRISHSEMGSIEMVTIDIRPAKYTLEWLIWILTPRGDMNEDKHRVTFEVGRLEKVDLLSKVEKLTDLSLSPL